jgi:hypothetical protein
VATPTLAKSPAPRIQQDTFKCAECKWTGVFAFGRCPNCGSFKLYNVTPEEPFDGHLIDNLVEIVERVEEPKPPQPAPLPVGDPRESNAAMLCALWEQGERWAAQAFELPQPKPDPLTIALNGFPDVYTSRAYQEGR